MWMKRIGSPCLAPGSARSLHVFGDTASIITITLIAGPLVLSVLRQPFCQPSTRHVWESRTSAYVES